MYESELTDNTLKLVLGNIGGNTAVVRTDLFITIKAENISFTINGRYNGRIDIGILKQEEVFIDLPISIEKGVYDIEVQMLYYSFNGHQMKTIERIKLYYY